MKIQKHGREVDYFGNAIRIEKAERWVAADANGNVIEYLVEPSPKHRRNPKDSQWSGANVRWIGTADLEGMDWLDTCVHYPAVED